MKLNPKIVRHKDKSIEVFMENGSHRYDPRFTKCIRKPYREVNMQSEGPYEEFNIK